ncbi:hypothetical protein [Qipengyuania vesicularis]|uniref:hypothetical protein n=1 Tax=Qipengyuania vesicularis TaxID=2867232 RepID=UPI001C87E664|nr:hypothetical protein [Qipengyuania vesicularis]MBX7526960.1 hypothetical protein [Qipengyuania vesicularis]
MKFLSACMVPLATIFAAALGAALTDIFGLTDWAFVLMALVLGTLLFVFGKTKPATSMSAHGGAQYLSRMLGYGFFISSTFPVLIPLLAD